MGLHRTTLLALWAYTPRHSTTRPAAAPQQPTGRIASQGRYGGLVETFPCRMVHGLPSVPGKPSSKTSSLRAAALLLAWLTLTCRDTRLLLGCSGAASSSSSGSRCRRESTSTSSVWFLPSRFPPTSFNSHPLLGSGGGLRLYSAHVSYHTTAPLIPLCPKSPVGKTRVAAKSLTCRPAVPAKARRGAARLATALR